MADISSDNFSPDKYIEVIGSIAATRCQNDISPQLPASVCVAQAIKECGFDPNTIFFKQSDGKINYNIFNVVGPNSSGSRFAYCQILKKLLIYIIEICTKVGIMIMQYHFKTQNN